jgi:hypothetical protein
MDVDHHKSGPPGTGKLAAPTHPLKEFGRYRGLKMQKHDFDTQQHPQGESTKSEPNLSRRPRNETRSKGVAFIDRCMANDLQPTTGMLESRAFDGRPWIIGRAGSNKRRPGSTATTLAMNGV